jgi:hypothetical protein
MMVASPAGSKGRVVNPALASSWRTRMPRIEPVPTAPAPPIWSTELLAPDHETSARRQRPCKSPQESGPMLPRFSDSPGERGSSARYLARAGRCIACEPLTAGLAEVTL